MTTTGFNRVFGTAFKRPSGSPAPGCTIDVYLTGTTTHATLYADSAGLTPLANPFTSDAVNAYYDFYIAPRRVDIRISGTGITAPYTLPDVYPMQTDPAIEYDVRTYGAVLDGATDDTAAFNACIAAVIAAGGNAIIYVPAGTAKLTAQLTAITVPNVMWRGDGQDVSLLSWTDVAAKGIVCQGGGALNSLTLASNPAIGDRTFDVAAGQGAQFVVGEWIYFQDTAVGSLDGNGTFTSRVQGVSGDTITPEDLFPCAFTGAITTVFRYAAASFLDGMVFRDLGFRCAVASPSNKLTHLQFTRCHRPVVKDCSVYSAVAPLITTVQTVDALFANNDLQLSIGGAAAGIEVDQSIGTQMIGNSLRRCRFGLTFTNSPRTIVANNVLHGREPISTIGGRGIRGGGQSNFSVIIGNDVNDTALYGIYSQACSYISIVGNSVFGVGWDDLEHGIQIAAPVAHPEYGTYALVTGNSVHFCTGAGIIVNFPFAIADQPGYATITGNNVSNCKHSSILLDASYNHVGGNVITSPDSGVAADIQGDTGTTNNSILANTIARPGVSTFPAIKTTASNGSNTVLGNAVNGLSLLLHATDTSDLSNLQAAATKTPQFNTTQVATGANVLETEVARFTIEGGSLYALTHGFRCRGVFAFANNANLKTVRVYIGSTVFTGISALAGGPFQCEFDLEGMYNGVNTLAAWCNFIATKVDGAGNMPGGSGGTGIVMDWTIDQDIVVTMQNGVANAGDITFRSAKLTFEGVPNVPGF